MRRDGNDIIMNWELAWLEDTLLFALGLLLGYMFALGLLLGYMFAGG